MTDPPDPHEHSPASPPDRRGGSGAAEAPCGDLLREEGLARAVAAAWGRVRRPPESTALRRAVDETRRIWSARPAAPLIATGHQAVLRHPGILAKDLVAASLAEAVGGEVLRLLVDQDVHPIGPLQIPVRDAEGGLDIASIRCREPEREPEGGSPTGRRPPIELDQSSLPANLPPEIADGVAAIATALDRESGAPSAALQVAAAFDALAAPFVHLPRARPATELLATPIGLHLLATIADDPRRCAEAFNEALAVDPRAARSLAIDADRIEVPLWSIPAAGPRERVVLDLAVPASARRDLLHEAACATPSRLAPRGLLMSGLVRLVADLFIHGRGGWRYDRVTEAWFADWLGATLAPMVMATADVRLPLGEATASTESLRRRWHDPLARDSSGPSASKSALLQAIEAAPRGSLERREAFLAMHRQLDEVRRTCSTPPPPPRGDDTAAIAASREWAFPLYAPTAIDSLRAEAERMVREAIAATQERP